MEKELKEETKESKKNKKDLEKEKITLLENKVNELDDKNKRLQAEFMNYRNRTENEIANMFKYEGEDLIVETLNRREAISASPICSRPCLPGANVLPFML